MDKIFIRELKIDTLVGIYERERQLPQTIQLDLEIGLPNNRAAETGDINDALDYAKIIQNIEQMLAAQHYDLLETMVEHIANMIRQDFGASWVKVSVAKLQAIRNCKMVGVCIERGCS